MHTIFIENTSVIELNGSDKIVATTKVSIPQGDGPIEATSTIEAVPGPALYNHFDRIDNGPQLSAQSAKKDKKYPESSMVICNIQEIYNIHRKNIHCSFTLR